MLPVCSNPNVHQLMNEQAKYTVYIQFDNKKEWSTKSINTELWKQYEKWQKDRHKKPHSIIWFLHYKMSRVGKSKGTEYRLVVNMGWGRRNWRMNAKRFLLEGMKIVELDCGGGCAVLVLTRSVMPNSLQPHELQPTRFLCSWAFPGNNTGVGCHALLQRIFPIKGSNPGLPHCR